VSEWCWVVQAGRSEPKRYDGRHGRPLGRRFAAAMFDVRYGPRCTPVGTGMPLWRHPLSQRRGGVPSLSHSIRALWRASMRALEM
jgi:hypothetical protein